MPECEGAVVCIATVVRGGSSSVEERPARSGILPIAARNGCPQLAHGCVRFERRHGGVPGEPFRTQLGKSVWSYACGRPRWPMRTSALAWGSTPSTRSSPKTAHHDAITEDRGIAQIGR